MTVSYRCTIASEIIIVASRYSHKLFRSSITTDLNMFCISRISVYIFFRCFYSSLTNESTGAVCFPSSSIASSPQRSDSLLLRRESRFSPVRLSRRIGDLRRGTSMSPSSGDKTCDAVVCRRAANLRTFYSLLFAFRSYQKPFTGNISVYSRTFSISKSVYYGHVCVYPMFTLHNSKYLM